MKSIVDCPDCRGHNDHDICPSNLTSILENFGHHLQDLEERLILLERKSDEYDCD